MPKRDVDPKKQIQAWVYDAKLKQKEESKRFRHSASHNIYGSAQLTPEKFVDFLTKTALGHSVTVFDLRQESHLILNDSIPISLWRYKNNVNKDKSLEEVDRIDKDLVESICLNKTISIHNTTPYLSDKIPTDTSDNIEIKSLQTWGEYVKSLGVDYKRIPITDHHRPYDDIVDLIVENIRDFERKRTLDPDTTLLVHCRGGRGRTTTIMSMCSMLLDTNDHTLEQILHDQHRIGGVGIHKEKDISEAVSDESTDTEWKDKAAAHRSKFINEFYAYAKDPNGYRSGTSWTQWLKDLHLKTHMSHSSKFLHELEDKQAAKHVSANLSMLIEQSIVAANSVISSSQHFYQHLRHPNNSTKLENNKKTLVMMIKNSNAITEQLASLLDNINARNNKFLKLGIDVGNETCAISQKATDAANAMIDAVTAQLRLNKAKEEAALLKNNVKRTHISFSEVETQAQIACTYAEQKLKEVKKLLKQT